MSEQKERENYDYYDLHLPERKLELVDGRLLVGKALAGSRLLLDHILQGWSVDAAVALCLNELWLEALCEAFHLSFPESVDDSALKLLKEKASRVDYVVEDSTFGGEDRGSDAQWLVRNHLHFSLYEVSELLGGSALGRDFVMRLGENGFTPDSIFFKNKKPNKLYEYYLDDPAELVIEVTRPAHKVYDAQIKREYYARGGVPEYLIVDAEKKEFEYLRLVNGDYVAQTPGPDGLYRSQSVPGLAIAPKHLFPDKKNFSLRGKKNPFLVEEKQPYSKGLRGIDNGLGWGELLFEPRVGLQPVTIRFEEYICWCPESKFEFWDDKIQICGDEGVRNLLGLLLMTFGLVDVCRLALPVEWIDALERRRKTEASEQITRDEWRRKALQATAILREKFHVKRVAIIGDLLSSKTINYWSRLSLAIWDMPAKNQDEIYGCLSAMDIDFIEADRKYFQKKIRKGQIALEEI